MTGLLLLDTVLFALATALPGILLVRAALPDLDGYASWGGGVTVGLFLIPLLSYTAAVLFRTHISAALVLAIGGAVALPPGVILWRRAQRHTAGS